MWFKKSTHGSVFVVLNFDFAIVDFLFYACQLGRTECGSFSISSGVDG